MRCACATGRSTPQRGRALPADALPRERRELREAHGGEAALHANALRFAVVRDPFAWFPSLFAHAVHELRTAPRFATAALLDAECAADPCDWRHCSKAARKAAADKEATPAVTARRFRAWVRELVSGRRPASHLCERPGGSWLGLQTDWLDVAAADFGVDCLVPLEELGEFWALLSANSTSAARSSCRASTMSAVAAAATSMACTTARRRGSSQRTPPTTFGRGVADASEAAVTRFCSTAGLKRRASCAPLERAARGEGARAPVIGGMLRTYSADRAWLVWALRSIRRFAYPLISSLTVVYPEGEAANFTSLLRYGFPWVRPRASTTDGAFAARAQLAKADRTSAKAWMPSGYAAQIYDKLAFDAYVPADTDVVIFFDSDTVLLRPLLVSDVLEPATGRPLHPYRPWEYAGRMAETAWRESTSRVLGAPLNHTFMYRQGQAYPAGLGACLRETLASEHGAPSFLAYALDAYADSGRKQYSEFELMGAFLWALPRRGGAGARAQGLPILQRRSWSGLNEQTALLFECVLGTRPTAAGSEWTGLGWRDNEVLRTVGGDRACLLEIIDEYGPVGGRRRRRRQGCRWSAPRAGP